MHLFFKNISIYCIIIIMIFSMSVCGYAKENNRAEDPLAWWREAKFGLFIHWGIYSLPAGVWKGQKIPYIAEWIQKRARIPIKEYEQLARQFNPTQFDADEWVRMVKNAGMKYIVITSKHHDGFAMFDSKVSTYDIMDMTPFGRDPLKELATACKKYDIRLGFYYSNEQDWHHPGGRGNDWDFPEVENKDFAGYLEEKVKPQVRELLTNYGPISIIWYDTPQIITKEQSQSLVDLVHELEPNCLVNNRVGHGLGDYQGFGDNQLPGGVIEGDWETIGTINDSWGYKSFDHNWKSTKTLLHLLTNIVSKGGVYLLNVGPTAKGIIPKPSVDRLLEMGDWLKINGEAIYGANPSPFAGEFRWGAVTAKPGRLFLHIAEWPQEKFELYGLKSKVKKAYFLADPVKKPLKVTQNVNKEFDVYTLSLDLPQKAPDKDVTVIVLEIDGEPQVDNTLIQRHDHHIILEAFQAKLSESNVSKLSVGGGGVVENWLENDNELNWEFKVLEPGKFDAILFTAAQHWHGWVGGHEVKLESGDQTLSCTIKDQGRLQNMRTLTWQDAVTKAGQIHFNKAGVYRISLKATRINQEKNLGFRFRTLQLVPASEKFMQTTQFVEPVRAISDEMSELKF